MAASPHIVSLSEYLHTSYRPDCDFVDDHIEERNLGELDRASALLDPATGLHLDLPALFAAIDEDQAR